MTAAAVRRLRERLDLTQAELGARVGLTQAQISQIETGKRGVTRMLAQVLAGLEPGRREEQNDG